MFAQFADERLIGCAKSLGVAGCLKHSAKLIVEIHCVCLYESQQKADLFVVSQSMKAYELKTKGSNHGVSSTSRYER
jgi:hypothetical protein